MLYRHERFQSAHLPDARDVVVYVPPGYADGTTRRFPVLYLHDGQNLFDGDESFIKGESWRLGDHADASIASGDLAPLIIVGIHNTGDARVEEYTPTATRRLGGGQAAAYGRLIVEELKPFIDRTYRTVSDAAYTGIGGSSLGGLVSLYLGLRYADVFSRVAAMSPSVWWDRRVILRDVRAAQPRPGLRIWLDIGLSEGKKAVDDVRLLHVGLVKAGWQEGVDLSYSEYHGARHSEAAWGARSGEMLQWLFPPRAERDCRPPSYR